MIVLYKSTETDFKNNGLAVLDRYILDPVVEEHINGIYSLTFKLPLFIASLEEESIIKCNVPDREPQLFRIKQLRKNMGFYEIYAVHITYDLIDNFIEDINLVELGPQSACERIQTSAVEKHNFKINSDMGGIQASARLVRKNPIQCLISDDENSFINRWGGEIYRDNFNINMKKRLGIDSSVEIRYRKNLLGYEADIDFSEVHTKIMPKGADGLLLPEKYVISDKANNYFATKIAVVEFPDIKAKKEGEETEEDKDALPLEEAYKELRRLAKLQFTEQHIDEPKANYKVNFIELSKTEEYKDIKALEFVNIGDTVRVVHEKENLDIHARVIAYKYNPLEDRYIEIELGNFLDNLSSVSQVVQGINRKIDNDLASALESAKTTATNLIKDGFGGHVRIHPDRILIMDTEDENTAKKVWQWNKNGFGYSKTGVNGEYGLAMTMDGSIVADFITSGSINANLITAGVLKGKNFNLDLVSGTMVCGTKSGRQFKVNADGSVVMPELLVGDIPNDSISVDKLKNGAVSEDKIQYGAITYTKIKDGAITTGKIQSGAITTDKIQSNSITASKIQSGAITADKIQSNSITASKISSGAITTDLLYPGANERIVLERGYGPGSNDAMSIDANGDAIRLKYSASNYVRVKAGWIDFFTIFSNTKTDGRDFWAQNYNYMSDVRMKENIKFLDKSQRIKETDAEMTEISSDDIYNFIRDISFATYTYKFSEKNEIGLISQMVEKYPRVKDYLISESDSRKYINTAALLNMGIVALKKEIDRNDKLEERIRAIEEKLN